MVIMDTIVRQLPGAIANGRQDLLLQRVDEQLQQVRGSIPQSMSTRIDAVSWSMPVVHAADAGDAVGAVGAGTWEEEVDSEDLSQPTQNVPGARLAGFGGPPAAGAGGGTTSKGIAAACSADGSGAQRLLECAAKRAGETLRRQEGASAPSGAVAALDRAVAKPVGGAISSTTENG